MHIECRTCPVRDRHCADCMVTVLLEMPAIRQEDGAGGFDDGSMPLEYDERRALRVLVDAGLVAEEEAGAARAVLSGRPPLRVTG